MLLGKQIKCVIYPSVKSYHHSAKTELWNKSLNFGIKEQQFFMTTKQGVSKTDVIKDSTVTHVVWMKLQATEEK